MSATGPRFTADDCAVLPEPDASECFDAFFPLGETEPDSDRRLLNDDDADRNNFYDEPDPADF